MGCLRLRHNYFRASNVSSYVVLETFFGFLLVDLPRHSVHEFVDLQDSCQNITSSDWRVLPATMHARANLSSVGVIIATKWIPGRSLLQKSLLKCCKSCRYALGIWKQEMQWWYVKKTERHLCTYEDSSAGLWYNLMTDNLKHR